MPPTSASILTELSRAWPWFVPAWAFAAALAGGFLSLIFRWTGSESMFFLAYFAMLLASHCMPIVPIRRGVISLEHAMTLVIAAWIPSMVVLFARMGD